MVVNSGATGQPLFERVEIDRHSRRDMGTTFTKVCSRGSGQCRRLAIVQFQRTEAQFNKHRDHSLVASLVASKQITAAEAKVHPQRNAIYRTIGDKPRIEADVFLPNSSRRVYGIVFTDYRAW